MCKSLHALARIIIEILWLDEDFLAVFAPNCPKFRLFPGELMSFGIKIQRQKPKIVAGKVVFVAGVA